MTNNNKRKKMVAPLLEGRLDKKKVKAKNIAFNWGLRSGLLEGSEENIQNLLTRLMEVDIGLVSHAYTPIRRCNIINYNCLMRCVWSELEWKCLAWKCCKCLIWCSPIVAHAHPSCFASFHPHACHVTASRHVHHVYQ